MKRVLAFLVVATCWATAFGYEPSLSVTELYNGAAKHDGKVVTVRGLVTEFKAKTSKKGTKYTTFKIKGGRELISVYVKKHLEKPLAEFAPVQITGIFRKEKKVGNATFKNEVDATPEKGKPYGIKRLPPPKRDVLYREKPKAIQIPR